MNLQTERSARSRINTFSRISRDMLRNEHPAERFFPLTLTLNEEGYIQECGPSIETIFGYSPRELIWQHISCLFPTFSEATMMQGVRLNPMLNYLCHCGHVFEAINKRGEIVTCNLNFFLVENKGLPPVRLLVRPVAKPSS